MKSSTIGLILIIIAIAVIGLSSGHLINPNEPILPEPFNNGESIQQDNIEPTVTTNENQEKINQTNETQNNITNNNTNNTPNNNTPNNNTPNNNTPNNNTPNNNTPNNNTPNNNTPNNNSQNNSNTHNNTNNERTNNNDTNNTTINNTTDTTKTDNNTTDTTKTDNNTTTTSKTDNNTSTDTSTPTNKSSLVNIKSASFTTNENQKGHVKLNLGSEHSGEQVTISATFYSNGKPLNPGTYIAHTIPANGEINIDTSKEFENNPDSCTIIIKNSDGIESKVTFNLKPQNGTQTITSN